VATSIIVGMGEVGRALHQVLSKVHIVITYDSKNSYFPTVGYEDGLKVLHICFGYDDNFSASVKQYQKLFQPSHTIIHSTTPVGTCKALESYHSPVRGVKPYLAESLIGFTTYLAPKNTELKAYPYLSIKSKFQE